MNALDFLRSKGLKNILLLTGSKTLELVKLLDEYHSQCNDNEEKLSQYPDGIIPLHSKNREPDDIREDMLGL